MIPRCVFSTNHAYYKSVSYTHLLVLDPGGAGCLSGDFGDRLGCDSDHQESAQEEEKKASPAAETAAGRVFAGAEKIAETESR